MSFTQNHYEHFATFCIYLSPHLYCLKNKDIILYSHSPAVKIRKFTLITLTLVLLSNIEFIMKCYQLY